MGVPAWPASDRCVPSVKSHSSLGLSLPIYKRKDWREGFLKVSASQPCASLICLPTAHPAHPAPSSMTSQR